MKGIVFFIGLLTVLGGLWPFIKEKNLIQVLDFIPATGDIYQGIIVIIGILAIAYSVGRKKKLVYHGR